jgi:hypothetical protein
MKYLIVVLPLLLFGCGGGSGGSSNDVDESYSIAGSWVSNCYLGYNAPENIWVISEYHFTESEVASIDTNYSDEDCTTQYTGGSNLWEGFSGSYIQLTPVSTTSGINSNWYELTYNIDPPLETDLIIEMGFFVNNDELSTVIENDGFYYIVLSPKYYKQ